MWLLKGDELELNASYQNRLLYQVLRGTKENGFLSMSAESSCCIVSIILKLSF